MAGIIALLMVFWRARALKLNVKTVYLPSSQENIAVTLLATLAADCLYSQVLSEKL